MDLTNIINWKIYVFTKTLNYKILRRENDRNNMCNHTMCNHLQSGGDARPLHVFRNANGLVVVKICFIIV